MNLDKFIDITLKPTKAAEIKDWYFCLLDASHREVEYKGYARMPFTHWDTPAMRFKNKKRRKIIVASNAHRLDFGVCKSTPEDVTVKYIGIGCNLGIMFEAEVEHPILVSKDLEFSVAKGDLTIEDPWADE